MLLNKIKGLFRLLRFELPLSAGICVIMGQLLATGIFPSISIILAGFFSVFFISASVLVLNDYFDVETDKINAPQRPIPSGNVTKSEALWLSIFLLLTGVVLSYLLNIAALVSVIILFTIGLLYNWKFKKTGLPGNLMVSFSVGMTFIYGGISTGLIFNNIVWLFSAIAALIDLGEEIAADAMDAKGDALINSKSLAIRYGRSTALSVSASIFFIVILLSIIPFILNWFTIIYFIPIFIMDISIAYSAIRLLKANEQKGRQYIRWIYLGATSGIFIFIVMRVIGI